jgi:hypothetical protein
MKGESENAAACESFQRRLAEWLATGDKELYQDPHLENCAYCRALLVDLETISEAARDVFGSTD